MNLLFFQFALGVVQATYGSLPKPDMEASWPLPLYHPLSHIITDTFLLILRAKNSIRMIVWIVTMLHKCRFEIKSLTVGCPVLNVAKMTHPATTMPRYSYQFLTEDCPTLFSWRPNVATTLNRLFMKSYVGGVIHKHGALVSFDYVLFSKKEKKLIFVCLFINNFNRHFIGCVRRY